MPAKGVDVEALSPRDANAQRPRPTTTKELKSKAVAQLKANKEKDHPPPPPPNVTEPPSADRKDGGVYQVGKLLGKGGFAVCYEGTLGGTKNKFALKIVKSKMPAKMEQKVIFPQPGVQPIVCVTNIRQVPNGASNPLQDEA